ncbi:MAG TPA: HAD family phosphatase, partial [Dehalococcoidia bacterium]
MASDVAVLFDLDGVIVDSREHHMAAWEAWAREHAPNAPDGYFLRSFGLRNDAIIGGLRPDITTDELQRLADEKERLFRSQLVDMAPLPGLMALLDWAQGRAIKMAVVTNAPRANA